MHHNRPNTIKYCTNYIIANFYLCKQAFFLLTISAEVFEMAFCINCGQRLQEGAKFCANCGKAVNNNSTAQRKITYEGEVHKCPNCGAVVNSFIANCPACGYEFRGTKASNTIKEFASKLENIETKREYEKPRGLFAKLSSQQTISKADEQKISLIKSFPVPNTKEDMLEFMILATSSMRMSVYDSTNNTISKGEKEVNAAWLAKAEQVYEKAKRVYSASDVFTEINEIYNQCLEKIKKTRKKGIIKWILRLSSVTLIWIFVFVILLVFAPKKEAKEITRLENIVIDTQEALDNGEYEHALRIADSIDYQGYEKESEREWDIQRAFWVDKVLEEADYNDVHLEYTPSSDIDNANESQQETSDGGFFEGLNNGIQSGSK